MTGSRNDARKNNNYAHCAVVQHTRYRRLRTNKVPVFEHGLCEIISACFFHL